MLRFYTFGDRDRNFKIFVEDINLLSSLGRGLLTNLEFAAFVFRHYLLEDSVLAFVVKFYTTKPLNVNAILQQQQRKMYTSHKNTKMK